jgi:Predicted transcriptional regulator, consists of a Zn-ribbon and ATP-cone domains
MLKKNKQLCPICNESVQKKSIKTFNLNDTAVTDSRVTKNGTMIRRRRLCSCGSGYRFTTYERIHRPELTVVKRNGQIIPFNKERIYQSVKIALNGCVDQEKKTEQVSNEVNEKIQDIGKDSVPTKKIGEFILKALKERDKIGYVRFYGVFNKVNDPKEYKKIVDTLH